MIKDLALDTSGDLYFTKDGDVVVTDSLRQAIQIKLRWSLAEWKYNEELGIPYFEKILVKKPNTQEIAPDHRRIYPESRRKIGRAHV